MSLLQEIKDIIEHFRAHGHEADLPDAVAAPLHRIAEAVDNLHPGVAAGAGAALSLEAVHDAIAAKLQDEVRPFLQQLQDLFEKRVNELETAIAELKAAAAVKPAEASSEQSADPAKPAESAATGEASQA